MATEWPAMPSTPEQQKRFDAAVALAAEAIADAREAYLERVQGVAA